MKISRTLYFALYAEMDDIEELKPVATYSGGLEVDPNGWSTRYGNSRCPIEIEIQGQMVNGELENREYYLFVKEE